ncbi:MAG TPA: PRC-barrel domain-containing protein [Stellaceae bacterium]|jgi:hypothetical protein|nr:PRC-barrel domain-containing protein [Stellaceae bacterium]
MTRIAAAALLLFAALTASAAAQTASTPEAPPAEAQKPPAAAADTAPGETAPGGATPSNTASTDATKAKPTPQPPTANLETLVTADARDILGQKVSGAAGEDMGLVVDVLFDANKQPRAAVIDFGGFLGVGTRKIAVDWKLLQLYAPDAKTPLKLDLSRADVQNAPEYKPSDKSVSVIAGPAPAQTVTPAPSTPPSAAPPPASPAPAPSDH